MLRGIDLHKFGSRGKKEHACMCAIVCERGQYREAVRAYFRICIIWGSGTKGSFIFGAADLSLFLGRKLTVRHGHWTEVISRFERDGLTSVMGQFIDLLLDLAMVRSVYGGI